MNVVKAPDAHQPEPDAQTIVTPAETGEVLSNTVYTTLKSQL
ncbi:GntR family transcriptional regulator, partial [Ochrobactrum sp. CM-21-5]|nr:GntR family transcriptional regulator [Ochrobactrum sp. CM-21-5]MBC2887104.1 GntR family transcriptional regulator [Ochrobactrum sp. CM-21-5]